MHCLLKKHFLSKCVLTRNKCKHGCVRCSCLSPNYVNWLMVLFFCSVQLRESMVNILATMADSCTGLDCVQQLSSTMGASTSNPNQISPAALVSPTLNAVKWCRSEEMCTLQRKYFGNLHKINTTVFTTLSAKLHLSSTNISENTLFRHVIYFSADSRYFLFLRYLLPPV